MNQPPTPVVVGVGQASERLGAPDYQRRSPVDLAADAAREALADTGADPAAVAATIDTVARFLPPIAEAAIRDHGRCDHSDL